MFYEGGIWVHAVVSLLVTVLLYSIKTQKHYYNPIFTLSNTQVELSPKHMMYRNEHRSSTKFTVYLSFTTTISYDAYHI